MKYNRKLHQFTKVLGVILILLLVLPDRVVAQNPLSDEQPTGLALPSQILNHLRTANWEAAFRAAIPAGDPLLYKYAYWRYLRDDATAPTFEQLNQFMISNPSWPGLRAIQGKAEYQIPAQWNTDQILAWFKHHPPVGLEGKKRLAEAYLSKNEIELAKPLLQDYWRNAVVDLNTQAKFYEKYRAYLTQADNVWRLNTMIENKNYLMARAFAKFIGRGFPALAEAQIAYAQQKKNASALYNKVHDSLRGTPGLMLAVVRAKRDQDKTQQAVEYLSRQPKDHNDTIESWWDERQILARRLIKAKSYQTAYNITIKHGLTEGVSYVEAEFLAGWLALQKLNRPDLAYKHFKSIYEKPPSQIALARACYWLARVYEKTKDAEYAKTWFGYASKFPVTFYGQIARQHMDEDGLSFDLPGLVRVSGKSQEDFDKSDLVRIVRMLHQNNELEAADSFIQQMFENSNTAEQLTMLINLANDINRRDLAVMISRQSRLKGFNIIKPGFPIISLAGNVDEPEDALVHAIIRQESSFDTKAKSPAGAMGLMQLMPVVAKNLSRQLRITYKPEWLINRPEFNVTMGRLLLQQKIKTYDQNYTLAIAAYNAGPSRVNEWIADYGDPRKGEIELVDWIELIPFSETRGYVHRVLENLVVYRYLLNGPKKMALLN